MYVVLTPSLFSGNFISVAGSSEAPIAEDGDGFGVAVGCDPASFLASHS
jgi:hypothetical protein